MCPAEPSAAMLVGPPEPVEQRASAFRACSRNIDMRVAALIGSGVTGVAMTDFHVMGEVRRKSTARKGSSCQEGSSESDFFHKVPRLVSNDKAALAIVA